MNPMAKSGTMKADHRSLFPKRNKRGGNQANHEREHLGILHAVRLSPTYLQWRDGVGGDEAVPKEIREIGSIKK
jgi:hypothetical protein